MTAGGLVAALRAIVGDSGLVTEPFDLAPHLTDWRKAFSGAACCMVKPGSSAEVAEVVRASRRFGRAIVVQGGITGLAGGATPDRSGEQVLLSLSRMSAIREIDPVGLGMVLEAGCILKTAQEAARAAGALLPVSFAAEGSATIGGAIATNAGGINVLRYGTTRNIVLGLEAVLADGTIVSGLRQLRKNNAGYDWKHLLIGTEGTLGIVTAAAIRLAPLPRYHQTALVSLAEPAAALALLALAQVALGDQISAFELISPRSVSLLRRELGLSVPLAEGWLVLIEAASSLAGLEEAVETMLMAALEKGLARDGVVGQSEAQANALWAIRENISEAEARSGASAKHDISVPVAAIPAFLECAGQALAALSPPPAVNVFGHVGDGNLHYNVLLQPEHDVARINHIVHSVAMAVGGSISAEHGIGQYRVAELARSLAPAEMQLLRTLKNTLDPDALLNPGKVLAAGIVEA